MKTLIALPEMAEAIYMSADRLEGLIHAGQLPAHRVGNEIRLCPAEVKHALRYQQGEPAIPRPGTYAIQIVPPVEEEKSPEPICPSCRRDWVNRTATNCSCGWDCGSVLKEPKH